MQSRPTVVVLAAGKGSRFKGSTHKLEQSLGGLSVLGRTLRNAIESHLPVVVVTTQALAAGAAQLVEVRETVKEITVSRYVEAEPPVGPVPAAPSSVEPAPLLFNHLSEDELLGYGVPAEWLSDVRRATEESLLALAEQREVMLFDEWAADQDPQFRRIFYQVLLPRLKEMGKTVIAIG